MRKIILTLLLCFIFIPLSYATQRVMKYPTGMAVTVPSTSEVGAGSDTTAIHDDTASEISAITEKSTPVSADMIIIEDSADSNNKKMVQVGNLPASSETDPIVGAINGIPKADGAGNISTATPGTDYIVTETDPIAGAVNGIVQSDGAGNLSAVSTFSELQAAVTDKTLVNEEDAVTWDAAQTFNSTCFAYGWYVFKYNVRVDDNVPFTYGTYNYGSITWDRNGANDDVFVHRAIYNGTDSNSLWLFTEGLDPNNWSDFDDMESPTIVIANSYGADANDYGGVLLGS